MNINVITTVEKTTQHIFDVKPEDYLTSPNVQCLKMDIIRKTGSHVLQENEKMISIDVKLSQEFIDKWKKLAQYDDDCGLSEYHKNLAVDQYDQISIYGGGYLNEYKTRWSYNDFDYHYYKEFIFDNTKNYRCYLKNVSHGDYITTVLLMAVPEK